MHFVLGNILTVICVSYLHISTVRLYNAFHFGCSGIYRKIHKLKCINYNNSEKANNAKNSKTKLSWFTGSVAFYDTLPGTRWAYSTTLSNPRGEETKKRRAVSLCLSVDRVAEDVFALLCE